MKLIPVMTEKSMKLVKDGGFTFWLPMNLNKIEIRSLIEKSFGVSVVSVKTQVYKPGTKKNNRGKMQKIKGGKKAIVYLKEGDKIDLFIEEKKKTKKKGEKRSLLSSAGKK